MPVGQVAEKLSARPGAVLPVTLGEPVGEEHQGTSAEQQNRAKPSRSTATLAGDALLDDPAGGISVDLPFFGASHGLARRRILLPRAPGEPGENPGRGHLHPGPRRHPPSCRLVYRRARRFPICPRCFHRSIRSSLPRCGFAPPGLPRITLEEPPVEATREPWSRIIDIATDAGLLCRRAGHDPRRPCAVMSDVVTLATVVDVGSFRQMFRCITPVHLDAARGAFAPSLTVSGSLLRLY